MKVALVTGGSRGIGRAICLKLASMGYHVIINYVSNDAAAESTLKEIENAGGTGETMKFDVADQAKSLECITAWQDSHPGEYVELEEMNVIVKIPKDTVRLTIDCTILQDDSDELRTVQARLSHEDVQAARGAFLENVEDGDDYDASARKIFGSHYEDFLNLSEGEKQEARKKTIREYVSKTGLSVAAYKDFDEDPVKL